MRNNSKVFGNDRRFTNRNNQLIRYHQEQEEEPSEWNASLSSDWSPLPEDWYTGTLVRKSKGGDYFFIALSNGDEVFVFHKHLVAPHGHKCLVNVGDPVNVRIKPNDKKGSRWTALEAVCELSYPVPQKDEATIEFWNGTYGAATRDCGCYIFVTGRFDLNAGDRVMVSGFAAADGKHVGSRAT